MVEIRGVVRKVLNFTSVLSFTFGIVVSFLLLVGTGYGAGADFLGFDNTTQGNWYTGTPGNPTYIYGTLGYEVTADTPFVGVVGMERLGNDIAASYTNHTGNRAQFLDVADIRSWGDSSDTRFLRSPTDGLRYDSVGAGIMMRVNLLAASENQERQVSFYIGAPDNRDKEQCIFLIPYRTDAYPPYPDPSEAYAATPVFHTDVGTYATFRVVGSVTAVFYTTGYAELSGYFVDLAPDPQTVTFQNGCTTLEFAFKGPRVEMSSLKTTGDAQEWIANSGIGKSLCAVNIQRWNGSSMERKILDTSRALSVTHEETSTDTGKILTISWLGITYPGFPGLSGDFDVIGTIELTNGSPLSSWNVQVVSRLSDWGIESVVFPQILVAADANSELFKPLGLGKFYPNPVQYNGEILEGVNYDSELGGRYPGNRFTMQLMGLTSNNKTLYVAAHDPLAKTKDFHFKPTDDRSALEYALTHYPEAPMQAPYNWTCSYGSILGVLPGDWWHACRNYRQWVLANADWVQPPVGKAPANLPAWWVDTPLWDHNYYDYAEPDTDGRRTLSYILDYHDLLSDIPTVVEYPMWNVWDYDTHNPEFFPARSWYAGDVQTARNHGVEYCPYIEGLHADQTGNYWNNEGGSAYKLMVNHPNSTDLWPPTGCLQEMCPQTSAWQEKIGDLAGQIASDATLGSPHVMYIDVVGSAAPIACYSANHGHAQGNISDWSIGARQEIRLARQHVALTYPGCIFATEDASDCYGFEAPLMCNQTLSNMNCPMLMAVYGDRIDPWGYQTENTEYTADSQSWRMKLAEEFIYGMQVGCAFPNKATGKLDIIPFLTKLAQARVIADKYLSTGQMMHPPVLSGDIPTDGTHWTTASYTTLDQYISRPAVRASSWLANDGSAAIVFDNIDGDSHTVTWSIANPADLGLVTGSYVSRQIYPVQDPPVDVSLGSSLGGSVTVPANGPLVITLKVQPGADFLGFDNTTQGNWYTGTPGNPTYIYGTLGYEVTADTPFVGVVGMERLGNDIAASYTNHTGNRAQFLDVADIRSWGDSSDTRFLRSPTDGLRYDSVGAGIMMRVNLLAASENQERQVSFYIGAPDNRDKEQCIFLIPYRTDAYPPYPDPSEAYAATPVFHTDVGTYATFRVVGSVTAVFYTTGYAELSGYFVDPSP